MYSAKARYDEGRVIFEMSQVPRCDSSDYHVVKHCDVIFQRDWMFGISHHVRMEPKTKVAVMLVVCLE